MNKRTLPAIMLLATMSVAAQAAEMILYENPGFKGRELTVSGDFPDINTTGFDSRNASVLRPIGDLGSLRRSELPRILRDAEAKRIQVARYPLQ